MKQPKKHNNVKKNNSSSPSKSSNNHQTQPKPKPTQEKIETQLGKRKIENGSQQNRKINKVQKQGSLISQVNDDILECSFSANKISNIVKSVGFNYRLGFEAIFLINKATEKFLEVFSEGAYGCAVEDKKSFVGYNHISSAVGKEKRLDFLADFVPEKVASEAALAEMKPAQTSAGVTS